VSAVPRVRCSECEATPKGIIGDRYLGYGHGDLKFATTASGDGAVAQGGVGEAHQRQQSRRGAHEVHRRARAGGLPPRRLLLAEVESLPREELLLHTLTPWAVIY
jgi:hypothetical protein